MTTTHEPAYVTAMRRRHRALDTAVLNMVRQRGPISLQGLRSRDTSLVDSTVKASVLRLQLAGRVVAEPAPAPNTHWIWYRIREVRS